MKPRVAVLQVPGVNCETESVRALESVGLEGVIVPWSAAPETLAAFDAYLLPGGFSYQDRVRAGAVAARLPILEVVARRAEAGAPVLGLCNGAQVLVETGLVPGTGGLAVALAPNRVAGRSGYLSRWIWCEVAESPCLFTAAYAPGERIPLPVAHAEGRFVATPEAWASWRREGRVPLPYALPEGASGPAGEKTLPYPWNPNGAEANAAGVCNARGNVLALMPHPERAACLMQVPPDLPGAWGERRRTTHDPEVLWHSAGPGRGLFVSLAAALGVQVRVHGERSLPAAGDGR